MANPERGEVDLVAGNTTYILVLNFNAIAEIEALLDKGINEVAAMLRDPKDFRIGNWRVLLWGALRKHHKGSLEDAGDIMGAAGVDAVVQALSKAMTLSFPEASGDENPPGASASAGKTP